MIGPHIRIAVSVAAILYALRVAPAANFQVKETALPERLTIIAYGDMRFTGPSNTSATNPRVRQWLVQKIAEERPAALVLSGDVPWHGADKGDYDEYRRETGPWFAAKIRVYPALGNHELNGNEHECLENWWTNFPELRGHRWYSIALGDRVFILNLDSNSSLLPGSAQDEWLRHELTRLPNAVQFVFLNLHHPPVSDYQENGDAEHNARPNEIALAVTLKQLQRQSKARFVVTAGHVHNYERFFKDGIVYLVSGGGGAKPRPVIRTKSDLYQSSDFPNFHYVKFEVENGLLRATMVRVADPEGSSPIWEARDRFDVVSAGKVAALVTSDSSCKKASCWGIGGSPRAAEIVRRDTGSAPAANP